jgi:hypothetical protein
MFHSNSSNLAKAKYEGLGKGGDCFFRPMQREEVSSLAPAGVAHHPPRTAAGLRDYLET